MSLFIPLHKEMAWTENTLCVNLPFIRLTTQSSQSVRNHNEVCGNRAEATIPKMVQKTSNLLESLKIE